MLVSALFCLSPSYHGSIPVLTHVRVQVAMLSFGMSS